MARIETIKTSDGENSVSFSPERGGIITSVRLSGTELLYMDESTFQDASKNVRGGVPILFPNFGPIDSPLYPNLPQHGLARIASEWKSETSSSSGEYREKLTIHTRDTRYPYVYSLEMSGALRDGACVLTQRVQNHETEHPLPIAMGLHPYFFVPKDVRKNIVFDFEGSAVVREQFSQWSTNETTTLIDNTGHMHITIPTVGVLTVNASPEYQKIAFWGLPDKDFICIEPIMSGYGGLLDTPMLVSPGESFEGQLTIGFVREVPG